MVQELDPNQEGAPSMGQQLTSMGKYLPLAFLPALVWSATYFGLYLSQAMNVTDVKSNFVCYVNQDYANLGPYKVGYTVDAPGPIEGKTFLELTSSTPGFINVTAEFQYMLTFGAVVHGLTLMIVLVQSWSYLCGPEAMMRIF